MSNIRIENAVKKYGQQTVIKNIHLEIENGEFFTLLGPSGCGKTTLLRMIAGFNSIEDGSFYFNDKKINHMEPGKRNIGMVFQNYAVFPNMTVRQNIEFGLKERKVDSATIQKEVDRMLELMQIEEHAQKKPQALSGGQQQRVALARAIVIKPDVLLMDEPLSNLDAKLRVELRETIRTIQKEVGITTVYVTHDQEEAMAVSDRIAVMRSGIIEQCASPREIYHKPKNLFVASFIGTNNVLKGKYYSKKKEIQLDCDYTFPMSLSVAKDIDVLVSVRPEDFFLTDQKKMVCRIKDSVFLGTNTHYHLRTLDDTDIDVMEESSFVEKSIGKEFANIDIKKEKINIFDQKGEINLTEA